MPVNRRCTLDATRLISKWRCTVQTGYYTEPGRCMHAWFRGVDFHAAPAPRLWDEGTCQRASVTSEITDMCERLRRNRWLRCDPPSLHSFMLILRLYFFILQKAVVSQSSGAKGRRLGSSWPNLR